MDQWSGMADKTPGWSRKRKSLERGDTKGFLPNKKFQSPLIITAPSGKTATKTKSRLPLFDGNGILMRTRSSSSFWLALVKLRRFLSRSEAHLKSQF